MRIARLRALTQSSLKSMKALYASVEMRIARLRAFTHKSPVHQTGLLCAFRTFIICITKFGLYSEPIYNSDQVKCLSV